MGQEAIIDLFGPEHTFTVRQVEYPAMSLTRFTVMMILLCGLLTAFPGSKWNGTFAEEKPGYSGIRVVIAGSVKVEGDGQPRKVTFDGKGFKAKWHDTGEIQVKEIALPGHWHVTYEKALGETPVVVATPCDTEVFPVALIHRDRKGFRLAGKTSLTPFGFPFIVVQK